VKEKGQEDSHKTVVHDPGVKDKRLFLREPELSRMFRAMALPGNTLWQIMRSGWDRPALLGATTSRAAAQVLRMSVIYALLDGSEIVRPQHLRAAREVWRYCEDSARYVLGEALDPMAERLLVAIRNAGEDGLSGTEIRDMFGRHASINEINRALAQLEDAGLVVRVRVKTAGRPATRWIAT
jgi:hypothetical protein